MRKPLTSNAPVQKALNIIREVEKHDASFVLEGDNLSVRVYNGASLPGELIGEIKAYKKEISDLIREREQSDSDKRQPGLIKLGHNEHGIPCFLFPGMPGLVHHYEPLGHALSTKYQPYGISYIAGDSPVQPHKNLGEIVAQALDEVSKIWKDGQVVFIGHSFGALVAFETVRALEGRGKQVEQLIVLDAAVNMQNFGTISDEKVIDAISFFTERYQLSGFIEKDWKNTLKGHFGSVPLKDDIDNLCRFFIDHVIAGTKQTYLLNVLHAYLYQIQMVGKPSGKINSDLLVIKAANQKNRPVYGECLGWELFCHRKVSSTVSLGDHESMVLPPHSESLAENIVSYQSQ
ncbi:hypothetical protein FNH22_09220 [Fulvivirga sp. M361]|uniref:thioesterase domain-containing protein n=1 Tax=Fulvivirga sp. M361 TaxID=2594266 RepID=UPI00117B1A53|nr:thioesterase domain-containing protein [Fulvivirga sp. M361]TRX60218.1 hypothetical protein FNH22_09220 [Fulvivirga sp. M361]